ncbi:hypothetical protein JCM21142_93876 [Saccharicrinis fermentans DSM 9555 = JCM 21142]|uniref:Uncharacterized protein n=1 Tax=Saccharicrinis fermentans DSM 9555 = JCM 21142 TaxID=869213 RepID=W7YA01_9BACT|nr:hypothetical protein JCM21142_93876 [Saccharicrinis fermentans DSM 9555 = JCM 21142]
MCLCISNILSFRWTEIDADIKGKTLKIINKKLITSDFSWIVMILQILSPIVFLTFVMKRDTLI